MAPQNIRRCEEFIALRAAEPITISDLIRISGASERMLFHEFRTHLDTSPMAYLKKIRLERAHADLEEAHPSQRSVAEIATEWGFTHRGSFAKDYRARFRRNPSDTLRRTPVPGYPDGENADEGGLEHGA
jgi:transcriptional regulator GlxA family with amidase domain